MLNCGFISFLQFHACEQTSGLTQILRIQFSKSVFDSISQSIRIINFKPKLNIFPYKPYLCIHFHKLRKN